VIATHAFQLQLPALAVVGGQNVQVRFAAGLRQFETASEVADRRSTLGVFEHSGVTARFHVMQNSSDRLLNGRIGGIVKLQQLGQTT